MNVGCVTKTSAVAEGDVDLELIFDVISATNTHIELVANFYFDFSCSSPDLHEGIYEGVQIDDFGTYTTESYNISYKDLPRGSRVQLGYMEAKNITNPNTGTNIIIDNIYFQQLN